MSQGMERPKVTFGDISRGWVIFLSLGFAALEVPPPGVGNSLLPMLGDFPPVGLVRGGGGAGATRPGGHLPASR